MKSNLRRREKSGSSIESKNGIVRVITSPGTILTKKSQCHERVSVIQPPSVGPMVGARLLSRPRIAGMRARCFPVKIA